MRYDIQRSTCFDPPVSIEDLCDSIAHGESLAQYCKRNNLHFGEIRRWIKNNTELSRMYEDAIEIRKEWINQSLSDIVMGLAGFDPKDILLPSGAFKQIHDWPPEARAALTSYEIDSRTGLPKVRFTDRLRAAELIGKFTGVFAENASIKDGKDKKTLADLILEAAKGKKRDGKKA